MSEDEINDIVGHLIDISIDLEKIDKQIKTCEGEIENFKLQLVGLRAKREHFLKNFNDLSQKMGEK